MTFCFGYDLIVVMDILTEKQVLELKIAHKQTREKRVADRIKAILMVHMGFTYEQIKQTLLLDDVTVRRYWKQYQSRSMAGLLEYRYSGGSSHLTGLQETELKVFFREHTPQTAKAVVDHITKTYNISYSVLGATKLLHRLGFVYKKPKVIPGKLDRFKQEEFLKTYKETKAQLGVRDHIYFLDATHPQHNTRLSYGWILKGKENDKFIKTNSGRARLNLHGALRLDDRATIVLDEETIDTISTLRLLRAIDHQQRLGNVYLILDNASYYHAGLVKQWVLFHPRFKLLFLPTYSPNLNIIERLWRFFHQKITHNRYFETFGEFKTTSLDFFKNLNLYEKELTTLLTDNFQLYPT